MNAPSRTVVRLLARAIALVALLAGARTSGAQVLTPGDTIRFWNDGIIVQRAVVLSSDTSRFVMLTPRGDTIRVAMKSAQDIAVLRGSAPYGSKAILVGAGVGLAAGAILGAATHSTEPVVYTPLPNYDVAVERGGSAPPDPALMIVAGGVIGAAVGALFSTLQNEQWVPLPKEDRMTLLVRPSLKGGRTMLGFSLR